MKLIDSVMFDFMPFYDRMANQLKNNAVIVEVGVANGASAIYLANRMREKGKSFKMHFVDNMDYGGMDQMNTIWRNIAEHQLQDFVEVIPLDSIEASKKFNGHSIDFLFLDSSHQYKETYQSIQSWYPKIIDEGIFAGHDYYEYKGVRKAVDELIPEDFTQEGRKTEGVLHVENTNNNCGLFWFKKEWYINLLK
jgi:hypothetical protein